MPLLAQNSPEILFRLHAPGLPDTAQVYLTGSGPQLGEWHPGKVAMQRSGPDTWHKTIYPDHRSYLQYKYTLGTWEREASDSTGKPLENFILKINSNNLVQDTVRHWRNEGAKAVRGGITGTVRYHRQIGKNHMLPARDLVVWLPPNYTQNSHRHYPVLYLHDGQNIFDPETSSFGVDWQADETADSLIRAGAMEPVIIVGIYNNAERMQEYVPGKKGSAYLDFVVNTVKPLIDSTYRTKPGRTYTATGGSSAGGTISFMLAWQYPQVFSKAITMSPAFKIQQIDVVSGVLAHRGRRKDIYLYIDNGGIELEQQLQPGIDAMLQALQAKGYRQGRDYTWVKDAKGKHQEADWAKRLPQALQLLFPSKY